VVLAAEFAEATQVPISVTIITAFVALGVVPELLTEGTPHCFSSILKEVLATSY
jgi:hypothetical protein